MSRSGCPARRCSRSAGSVPTPRSSCSPIAGRRRAPRSRSTPTPSRRRRVVPPARPPPARPRTGGRPAAGAAADAARRFARRSLPCAHRWEPYRARAPPDAARRRRLEPRPAVRRRTAAVRQARRCSPAGAALDAVESVCADDALDRADILDLLGRLVDKSLVVAEFDDVGRRALLAAADIVGVRAGAPRRHPDEADAVRERHAQWYPRPESAGRASGLRGEHGLVWRARIAAELGNLRGALDWYIERGDATVGARR